MSKNNKNDKNQFTIRPILQKYHVIEIELLLSHVLGKPKEFLYMNPKKELSSYQVKKLSSLIKRRLKGEPMAYILGYKDFYGLRFKVNKNVLIPRPETEWIVDVILNAAKNLGQRPKKRFARSFANAQDDAVKILDVGTGSGCIAVAIAKGLGLRVEGVDVVASDISKAALKVAKENARTHGVKIKFNQSDLLKNIRDDFDIIIANLPYGWYGVKNRFSSVRDGLKFEPKKALYTKEKGLMQIRRLLDQIARLVKKPTLIYLEFDPRQKQDLQKMIKKILPSPHTKFYKDFNNLWRYVKIK